MHISASMHRSGPPFVKVMWLSGVKLLLVRVPIMYRLKALLKFAVPKSLKMKLKLLYSLP